MSPSIALAVLAVALALGVVCLGVALRRRAEREKLRAKRLAEIAARIDAAVDSIRDVTLGAFEHRALPRPHAPGTAVGDLPGRTALLDAARAHVHDARSCGRRLSAAVLRAAHAEPRELAVEAHAVAEVDAFAVGPRAVALVLPGLGRAEALGVLARIEARCPSSGKAVELEPDEDAVELVARLLSQGLGSAAA